MSFCLFLSILWECNIAVLQINCLHWYKLFLGGAFLQNLYFPTFYASLISFEVRDFSNFLSSADESSIISCCWEMITHNPVVRWRTIGSVLTMWYSASGTTHFAKYCSFSKLNCIRTIYLVEHSWNKLQPEVLLCVVLFCIVFSHTGCITGNAMLFCLVKRAEVSLPPESLSNALLFLATTTIPLNSVFYTVSIMIIVSGWRQRSHII